jgi:hypothetical protein
MYFFNLILMMLSLASPAAQNSDVRFVLATTNGQTTFRLGEEINLEFRFSTGVPRKYEPAACYPYRRFVVSSSDTFNVEPAAGVVDPLRDSSYLLDGGPVSCVMSTEPVFIGGSSTVRPRTLNDWIQFIQPGHYRIEATTHEIRGLTLTSNAIEIDIVNPEPGWAETQARNAIATLRRNSQDYSDAAASDAAANAARTLRYLGTLDAVPGLIEFLGRRFHQEIDAGLISSPRRKEILSRLEAALVAPDVPISESWLDTLDRVAVAESVGPRPRSNDGAYTAQFRTIADHYRLMLADAVANKKAQARAVTLETLVLAGIRGAPAPDQSTVRALTQAFTELPAGDQRSLLSGYWFAWASPAAHSVVLAAARGTGDARNEALTRLLEFSAQEAREVVLDRVRKGDYEIVYGNFPEALLNLPDETLPELDEILAAAYEQGRPADRLIARYATKAIYTRVRRAHEKRGDGHCGEILAYFFRVDPDAAVTLRKDPQTGIACPLFFRNPIVRSAGLERVALEDLASADAGAGPPNIVADPALAILARGSVQVKDALLKRLAQLEAGSPLAAAIVRTILQPGDWSLTAEDFTRLRVACGSNSCRAEVDSTERSLQSSPIAVSFNGIMSMINTSTVQVGPFAALGDEQLRKALQKFPPGTQFRMQSASRWWADQQRSDRIRSVFTALGLELLP